MYLYATLRDSRTDLFAEMFLCGGRMVNLAGVARRLSPLVRMPTASECLGTRGLHSGFSRRSIMGPIEALRNKEGDGTQQVTCRFTGRGNMLPEETEVPVILSGSTRRVVGVALGAAVAEPVTLRLTAASRRRRSRPGPRSRMESRTPWQTTPRAVIPGTCVS